ncbi:MAG TPA: transcriptional regulator [Actinomycetota bacterium]|nr:transcriptional regulator [Actinomycetota bacterium]
MTEHTVGEAIGALAPLVDEVRRDLYLYILAARTEVGRDEAAEAVGISRALAAFHLDKLVDEGFLEAGYRRLSGKRGPGAGRPAKVYRTAGRQVDVSLPPRDYELAARVLLEASTSGDRRRRAQAARRLGRELGRGARTRSTSPSARERALFRLLESRGFQPSEDEQGSIRLANCPFDSLVDDYRDTVCGLNRSLLEGVVEGTGAGRTAVPVERERGCCVALLPGSGQRKASASV